jgi:hypothetical protein
MLRSILERGYRRQDGRIRAVASRKAKGSPIGPWIYEGTMDGDPNDVVPHEDRRELRGSYVLAAWLNHWDSREGNTLATWIDENGDERGYVRHMLVDFADSFGQLASTPGLGARRGHTTSFSIPDVFADYFSLGAIDRPWHDPQRGPAWPTLGYYDVQRFDADEWVPGINNAAFDVATERDRAWGARILAQIEPRVVRAAVAEAKIEQDVVRRELVRILLGRRDRLLRRWLRRLSPLTRPEVRTVSRAKSPNGARESGGVEAELCLQDLVVAAGLHPWSERPYWSRTFEHTGGSRFRRLAETKLTRRAPDRICVALPAMPSASEREPRYLIVDVQALWGADDERSRPLRVHLYALGQGRFQVAGLERPGELAPPG